MRAVKLPEVRWEWVAKMPPMPEQDAEELDLLRFSHPPGSGVIIDSNPRAWKSPVCIICGTWICSECWEFRRTYAIRSQPQSCKKCGSDQGYFVAIRHHWRVPDYHSNIREVPYVVPKIKEDNVHVPEEADAMTEQPDLAEAEKIVGCVDESLPPTCALTEEVEDHRCKYPYEDGDITVLGPEIFATSTPDGSTAIAWQGVWYKKMIDPDQPRREEELLRREAMDHAVKLAIADIGVGSRIYGSAITETAKDILKFLKGDS